MRKIFKEFFVENLAELNLVLSDHQLNQFFDYYEMIIEKNKVMNLTTITEMNEVIIKHFIDSLSVIKGIEYIKEEGYKILDLGTGAGFPGIPLKIAFPNLDITLLDSLNKKIIFLNEVIEKLELSSIVAIHGRAEEIAQDKLYREKFDFVVSRAVANISVLSEYCIPFVKSQGYFISYKAGNIEDELLQGKKAIFLLGGQVEEVISFGLLNKEISRKLVKIKKVKNTSKKYPRKSGTPSKEPIC